MTASDTAEARPDIAARQPERAHERPASPPRSRAGRRRLILGSLAILVILGVGYYGYSYWTTGRFLEDTDDAYTEADAVTVSPRISGQLVQVLVADNQPVKAGDILARIDDRDYQTALDQARATVAGAEGDIQNLDQQLALQQSTIAEAQATVDADQAQLTFATQDFNRYQTLAKSGAGSIQNAQQASAAIREKTAIVAHDQAALQAARQQVSVLQAQRVIAQAKLNADKAAARQAELNVSYTVLRAPVDGAVGDRTLRVGQYVQPGTALMQVVPMGQNLYVVGNFKETQLGEVGRGETVTISVDSLPGHSFKGTVDSLAPGSGSQFALLPPENATGNFTKIVQRVPVRIRFDNDPLLARLRPGLSVLATIDTRTAPPGPLQTLAALPEGWEGTGKEGVQEAGR